MKWKKIWKFIWYDDSIWSWLVNIVIAFIIVKFIIYPGLGFLLGTQFPIVAVVSSSMEHNGNFDGWWSQHKQLYEDLGITDEQFKTFPMKNGFNKGDIIILYSKKNIKTGDIIVFQGSTPEPIIHRIVKFHSDNSAQTKGDNNPGIRPDEEKIPINKIYGKSLLRVPLLGWFKILFVYLIEFFKWVVL